MTRSIAVLLQSAIGRLEAAGNMAAKSDAEFLMAHLLGCEPMALYGNTGDLSVSRQLQYDALISRRMTGQPVAYITGKQGFWSLELKVNEHTLIPRPDTETLVEVALKRASMPVETILDLGTGSGCILLSLLSEWASAKGVGVDKSAAALAVAEENARNCDLADRAELFESDWFSAIDKHSKGFSVIVSNPPYIPAADIEGLMVDVRDHEPISALDGGSDGLNPYRTLAKEAPDYMDAGGLLAVEVGISQAGLVAEIFRKNSLENIEITKDLGGIDRVVSAKKSK